MSVRLLILAVAAVAVLSIGPVCWLCSSDAASSSVIENMKVRGERLDAGLAPAAAAETAGKTEVAPDAAPIEEPAKETPAAPVDPLSIEVDPEQEEQVQPGAQPDAGGAASPHTPPAGFKPSGQGNEKVVPLADLRKQTKTGEALPIGFEHLANYVYKIPGYGEEEEIAKDQIPKDIKELNRTEVAIEGFMIPIQTKDGKIQEFALVRSLWGCCWGRPPSINEAIHVKMPEGKGAGFTPNGPITVFGDLEVGEVFEEGLLASIYRLNCEEIAVSSEYR